MTTETILPVQDLRPGDVVLQWGYDETGTGVDFRFTVKAVRRFTHKVRITWTEWPRPVTHDIDTPFRVERN